MSIKLHIDRLILEGLPFSQSEGELVQVAFEAELSRLISEGGLSSELQRGGNIWSVPAGVVQIAEGGGPRAAGKRIAGAVYSGLGNERS
jgi:hypothetical protein